MRYWLMKTEPSVFSFDDLVRSPKKTTAWEGVRNYQARNFMRDDFALGDLVLIYHSNAQPTAVAGVAEVVRVAYPDTTAMDPKSRYYDEKCTRRGDNPWVVVDVKAVQLLKRPVDRDELFKHASLSEMMVLRRGARLSVQPVTATEFKKILSLGQSVSL